MSSSTASTSGERVALIWTPPEEEGDRQEGRHDASHRKKSLVELNFCVDFATQSEPLDGTRKDIVDFFVKETTRDCFLSCGGEKKIEPYALTSELVDAWKDSCRHFESDNFPTESIDDCSVMSMQVQVWLPGVHLFNTLLSGIQLLFDDDGDDSSTPIYEMHTLAEKHEPRGLLAGLFDKLTGNCKIPKGHFYKSGTMAVSRVTIVEQEEQQQFALHGHIRLNVKLFFSATLLRLCPISKSKVEELARHACQKEIAKDLQKSLDKTRDRYHEDQRSNTADAIMDCKIKAAPPRILPTRSQSLYKSSFPVVRRESSC